MKIRIVLDTKVLASALMNSASAPGKVLKRLIANPTFEIVVSEPILTELKRVLFYPKVRCRIKGTDDDIHHWVEAITIVAHFVTPIFDYNTIIVKDDPDGDKFIIAAIEGLAKYIVSGDEHLLHLKKYQNIEILNPRDFIIQCETNDI